MSSHLTDAGRHARTDSGRLYY